jgi:hypothetical protein
MFGINSSTIVIIYWKIVNTICQLTFRESEFGYTMLTISCVALYLLLAVASYVASSACDENSHFLSFP